MLVDSFIYYFSTADIDRSGGGQLVLTVQSVSQWTGKWHEPIFGIFRKRHHSGS